MDEPLPEGRIHIAAACDEKYAMPLAVMLASVTANLGKERRVVAHVLESGLSVATRQKIARSIPDDRGAIRWIAVQADRLIRPRETLRSFDTVSIASYFRLLLPEVVPENLDRVIYLDCDLVVNHDLWDLWTVDIGDTSLGAVPELIESARYASSRAGIRLHRELGLRPDLELFNSGVMVVNLAKWRERQVASRAMTYLREAALYLRWHDQEALNAVVAGDWTPLDARWNVTMHVYRGRPDPRLKELAQTPRIVHYNAAIKPWQANFRYGQRDLFYRYLDYTAWTGWRPVQPTNLLLRRWPARLLRTARKARYAVGRRLQLGRVMFNGWRALHRDPRQISGPTVRAMRTREIRVFMVAAAGNPHLTWLIEYYLEHGADRVLLAVERQDEHSRRIAITQRDRLHLFLRPSGHESRHETLRQLLHRHGRGHWCVMVDDDELLLPARAGALSLTDLRDYFELRGYEALECQLRQDDAALTSSHESYRRVVMTASDPLNGRVFCVRVYADTSDRRVAEVECRSKVAMLKYRAGMLIDRELRGVQGARLADVAGILLKLHSVDAVANGLVASAGLARSTSVFEAFATQRISRGS